MLEHVITLDLYYLHGKECNYFKRAVIRLQSFHLCIVVLCIFLARR